MALAAAARGRPGAPAAAAAAAALRELLAGMERGAAAAGRAVAPAAAAEGDAAFLAARAAELGLPAGAALGAWAAPPSPAGAPPPPPPPPDQQRVLAAVGLATTRGLVAFAGGDFGAAADALAAARPQWGLLGGSHVQRDVLEQTLVAAAVEAGGPRARALASERATVFNASPRAWHVYGGAMRRAAAEEGVPAGRREQLLSRAVTAEDRAHALGLNQGLV
jgi:hypothetical protein